MPTSAGAAAGADALYDVAVVGGGIVGLATADVRRGGAGVRAQAIDPQGRLVDDFAVVETDRSLHVLNAPSPAATAALSIGEHLAERVRGWFA